MCELLAARCWAQFRSGKHTLPMHLPLSNRRVAIAVPLQRRGRQGRWSDSRLWLHLFGIDRNGTDDDIDSDSDDDSDMTHGDWRQKTEDWGRQTVDCRLEMRLVFVFFVCDVFTSRATIVYICCHLKIKRWQIITTHDGRKGEEARRGRKGKGVGKGGLQMVCIERQGQYPRTITWKCKRRRQPDRERKTERKRERADYPEARMNIQWIIGTAIVTN